MQDPASKKLSPPEPSKAKRKKSRRMARVSARTPPKVASIQAPIFWSSACSFGSASRVARSGLRMCSTCEYLSMKSSAFGTFESPRCTSDEPTHPPLALSCVARSSSSSAARVRGASCTRCSPCPVSRCSYGLLGSSRSCSARCHSRNMSFAISRHSVSVCSTKACCRACECVSRAPSRPSSIAREPPPAPPSPAACLSARAFGSTYTDRFFGFAALRAAFSSSSPSSPSDSLESPKSESKESAPSSSASIAYSASSSASAQKSCS
mmetsp:Transcript_48653/g.156450  ORF Transcript_48653/g.156450 Transcript_48653/m.156450 type:complete len:266 (+) Transcript_48653:212-1009(+)